MSEELYFFKINKEKAKTNLVPLLLKDDLLSFRDYLKKQEPYYSSEPYSFEQIVHKISTDITLLSIDELDILFYWFIERRNIDLQLPIKNEMLSGGLNLFHKIISKAQVRAYCSLLTEYGDISGKELNYICHRDELVLFLDFTICFSTMLELLLNDEFSSLIINSEIVQKMEIPIKRSGTRAYKLANLAYKRNLSKYDFCILAENKPDEWFSEMQHNELDFLHYDRNTVENELAEMQEIIGIGERVIAIINELQDYKGIIGRVHSY